MAARIFLAIFGLFSLPYGIYCFVDPAFLAPFAGVAATTTTGTIEIQAMYGGLQAGFGALALFGALRVEHLRSVLLSTAFLVTGLGLFRLLGAMRAGELSSYTVQGLAFEIPSAMIAIGLYVYASRRASTPA